MLDQVIGVDIQSEDTLAALTTTDTALELQLGLS